MRRQILLDEFLKEMGIKGHRKRYLTTTRIRLKQLFKYFEENDLEYTDVRLREAQEYQGWLIRKGREDGKKYAESSINSYVCAAASFFNFLKNRNIICSNPFSAVKRMREGKKIPGNVLREKQMNAVLSALTDFENGHLKERAKLYRTHVACEVLYATGLRIAELADVREEDIDFDREMVFVRDGKGGREGIVFLNSYAGSLLKVYLKTFRSLIMQSNNNETVFGTGYDNLSKLINKRLKKTCGKLNVPPITCHSIRHILGFHLLRAGCDIRYIQMILRHRRLNTTEIYTRVEKEDLKQALDTYHPRRLKRRKA